MAPSAQSMGLEVAKPRAWRWPSLCAHRGAGKQEPENTLAALRKGAELGARMAEVDVKLSRDGVAFLMHDERLERCSSGRGRARKKDWAELRELDAGLWHSEARRGERMPSLEEAAAFLIERGMAVNLEIKPCKGREEETGREVARLASALWAGQPIPPLLSSFSKEALLAAKAAAPDLPWALLRGRLKKGDVEWAQAMGAAAIHLNGNRASLAESRRVKAAGLGLAYYTINEPDIARKLMRWGGDCLITDKIEAIRAALEPAPPPKDSERAAR